MTTRPALDDFVGFESNAFAHDSHETSALYLLLFGSLLVTSIIVQQLVERYGGAAHHFLPEAAVTILVGMAVGGVVNLCGGYTVVDVADDTATVTGFRASYLGFNSSLFFFGFLPPIIYSSGYHLKRRLFFVQLGGILSLAVVGTSISIFAVALGLRLLMPYLHPASSLSAIECVCFASLISSTDPVSTLAVFQALKVDPNLFYLVFGESVLNDAVAITVFRVTSKFVGYNMEWRDAFVCVLNFAVVFTLSCVGGYVVGILAALLFRLVDFADKKLAAVAIFVSVVYIPFFLAETLQLSGIVTCLFAGISSRRYVNKNLCPDTRRLASFFFQLLAYLGDTSCFCLLGLSVFSQSYASFRGDLVGATLALILAARAAHVYPLLHAVNGYRAWRHRRRLLALGAETAVVAVAVPGGEKGSGKGTAANRIYVYTAPTPDTPSPFAAMSLTAESESEAVTGQREPAAAVAVTESIGRASEPPPAVDGMPPPLPPLPPLPPPRPSPPLIESNVMHMVWFASLRGAVAFACANIFPDAAGNRSLVVGTTTAVVLCTVFAFGSLTASMIGLLGIKANVDASAFIKELDAEASGGARLAAQSADFERRFVYPWVLRDFGRGHGGTGAVKGAHAHPGHGHGPDPSPAATAPSVSAGDAAGGSTRVAASPRQSASRLYTPLQACADSPSTAAPPSRGRLWGIAEGSDKGSHAATNAPAATPTYRPWGLFSSAALAEQRGDDGRELHRLPLSPLHLQHHGRRFSFGNGHNHNHGHGHGSDTPSSGGGSHVGHGFSSPVPHTRPRRSRSSTALDLSPLQGPTGEGRASRAASLATTGRGRHRGLVPSRGSPEASSAGGDVEVDEEVGGAGGEGSDDESGMNLSASAALVPAHVGVSGPGDDYVSDDGKGSEGSGDDADADADADSHDFYSVSTGSLDGSDARRRRHHLTERNLLSFLSQALASAAHPHAPTPSPADLLSPVMDSTHVWDFGRSGEDSDDDQHQHHL